MKQYLKQIKRHFPQLDSCRVFFFFSSSARCCATQQKADKKELKKKKKKQDTHLFWEVQKQDSIVSISLWDIFFSPSLPVAKFSSAH